jgi:hypothetical protein
MEGAIREMLALIIGAVYDDEKKKYPPQKKGTPWPAFPMT